MGKLLFSVWDWTASLEVITTFLPRWLPRKEIVFHVVISKYHLLFKLDSIKMFKNYFFATVKHIFRVIHSIFIPGSYLNITIVQREIKSKSNTQLIQENWATAGPESWLESII